MILNNLYIILIKIEIDVNLNILRKKNIDEIFNIINAIFEIFKYDIIHIKKNFDLILIYII